MQECAGDTSCSQRNCNDYDKCCLECSKLATGCNKVCKSLNDKRFPYFTGKCEEKTIKSICSSSGVPKSFLKGLEIIEKR